MSIKAGKVISILEDLAPRQLQAEWDNSGLQVGDRAWTVTRILIALEVTLDVIRYAADNGFDFVITHHPLIFKKLDRIDGSTPMGKIISLALINKISIYAMHTNLDFVQGGVSDALADLLSLKKVEVLEKQKGDYFKLAVFVPTPHLNQLRIALGDAGAGRLGNYSHCSYSSRGRGSFLPIEGASPWIGDVGKLEEVDESRLETIVEGYKLSNVLSAMIAAHPYEEVAYDLIPLANSGDYGLGRIGNLPQVLTLEQFTLAVGSALNCSSLRVIGQGNLVKKVAVCGGSGGHLVGLAHRRGADVLVTGDVGHHQALEAQELGLAVIDPGHYHSEYPVLKIIESRMSLGKGADVALYPGHTDPFRIITVS